MYVLSVRTQNELAFFRNIVGMDSVEKKEGYSSWRGTAFFLFYRILPHYILKKANSFCTFK